MSVIEDVRQGLQDFLPPQQRELFARLDSLEKVMNTRLDAQDFKLESIRKEISARFEAQDAKFDGLNTAIQGISDKLDLDRRLTKLESQQASLPAKTA